MIVLRFRSRLFVLALLLLAATGAFAQAASPGAGLLPVTQAFALTARIAQPGQVALHFDIAPHYYLYRGRISAKLLTPGLTQGALQLPPGEKEHDEYLGDVQIYHGTVDGTLAYSGTVAAVRVEVTYQGCHEIDPKICYPPNTETLTLTPGGGFTAPSGAASPALLPSTQRASGRALLSGMAISSAATANPAALAPPAAPSASDVGLAFALLLAFAGGLILNLMPCVLPILAIKAVGVLEANQSRARARAHALAYGAGVLASFLAVGGVILSLRAAGHVAGWGTQLQQPWLVALLACVLFVVGLAMSGVLQFGARLGNAGENLTRSGGAAGHFFTGVLAVVVASPCTAPFMGAALAYAFVAPALNAMLVLLALGVGLALPLVLIGLVPALARLLPKPGRWMETLKQVLAFPMYLSAVWLVWVLAHQRGADAVALALIAMVLLGAAAWWHGRARPQRRAGHVLTIALAMLALLPLVAVSRLAAPAPAAAPADGSVAFSTARLDALRAAGTPVFVDIGADWCVTCKANEYTVLDTPAFRNLLKQTGTVFMRGDWTDVDPEIGAYLASFHTPGVPLYVMYPRGAGAGRALPTLLTAATVRAAVEQATR